MTQLPQNILEGHITPSLLCLVFNCCLFVFFLDGSLFVITPVDPLFLVLPYLTKYSQKVGESMGINYQQQQPLFKHTIYKCYLATCRSR